MEAANLDLAAAKEAKEQLPFAIPVRSLEVSRKLAEAQFQRTEVTAPCNGTILKIYARPGETIGNKPILQMADLQKMVVVAEVYENEVKHIRARPEGVGHQQGLAVALRSEGLAGQSDADRPDDQFADAAERRSLCPRRPARGRGPRGARRRRQPANGHAEQLAG